MTKPFHYPPAAKAPKTPAFVLPPLPYGLTDLQPHLSEETLSIHYGRHHAKYIENLNRIIAEQDVLPAALEDHIRAAAKARNAGLFNNAAQAWNHSFFWESMSPDNTAPSEELIGAITETFGSFANLRERFIAKGAGHFGSGWVWLVMRSGALAVETTHDAATPLTDENVVPLLAADVWEHAYYIDYRQDRASWLAAWWDKLANWRLAEAQFAAAKGQRRQWCFPVATQ